MCENINKKNRLNSETATKIKNSDVDDSDKARTNEMNKNISLCVPFILCAPLVCARRARRRAVAEESAGSEEDGAGPRERPGGAAQAGEQRGEKMRKNMKNGELVGRVTVLLD